MNNLINQKYPRCPNCNKMNNHIRTSDDISLVSRCAHCNEIFRVDEEVIKKYNTREV